ncbi:MAG: hypothetical protein D6734_09400 [Candidatus Schekmanbacteria bacterium]|nr:MAG: hypothetical protein D6734_09400 [Candidatus Schekmanbacteria bacterium]
MCKKYCILLFGIVFLTTITVSLTGNHLSKFYPIKYKVIYRSSQPDLLGFLLLKKEGIKSIINLRDDRDDNSFLLKLLGFNYLHIKVKDRTPPSVKQVLDFISFISKSKNQPILIHCRSGKGRSGTFELLYHYLIERKPIDESIKETILSNKISDEQLSWFYKFAKSSYLKNYTRNFRAIPLKNKFATM